MTADLAALGARLRLLTDAQLRAVAGPTTFTRGQGYAAQRRVSGLAASSTWVVSAKVRGSGRIYQTQVELYLSRGEVLWTGECTCPMQVDCKHSVAVAIVARQTFGLAGAATLATPAAYVSDSDLARWAVVPALDEPASWTDQPPPDEYDRYDYDDDGYPDPLAALHHLHPGAPTTPGLPAWERAVRAVVGDTAATTTHFTPVGLLFEVQVTPPNRYSPPGSAVILTRTRLVDHHGDNDPG